MCKKVYNIIKMCKLVYIINYCTILTNIHIKIVLKLGECRDLDSDYEV